MSKPSVLIIGAGLGGLLLAQCLRKHQISVQVFERDPDRESRPQGWAVLLQWILKDLLNSTLRDVPPLELCSVTRELDLDTQFALFEASGKELIRVNGHNPEGGLVCLRVNRRRFRDWLSEHIDIQWNKRFTHYEEVEGGVKAFFDDGTTAVGDMLVGADGIKSHVRDQLLRNKPPRLNTIPLASLIGELTLTKEQYERQLLIAHSFYIIFGTQYRMFCGLKSVAEDQSTATFYWFLFWNDEKSADIDFWTTKASQKEMYEFALEKTKEIDPKLSELVRLTKAEGMVSPPIVVRDWVPEEIPMGRVTLLGDAAHPMTFFRGEGANHAMKDGLVLAKTINNTIALSKGMRANAKYDVPKMFKEYESEMLERGTDAVLKSRAAANGGIENSGFMDGK